MNIMALLLLYLITMGKSIIEEESGSYLITLKFQKALMLMVGVVEYLDIVMMIYLKAQEEQLIL